MKFTYLGETGLTVSQFALGTMNFGETVSIENAHAILNKAYDEGLIFWDTANIYGRGEVLKDWKLHSGRSERIIGEWIKKSGSRDNIVLSSKVRWPTRFSINKEGLNRKNVLNSLNRSLNNLQTDYLDIFFSHGDDKFTNLEDSALLFGSLVNNFKIHNIGLSNYQAYRIIKLTQISKSLNMATPNVIQIPYALTRRFHYELELENLAKDENFGVMAYSPLDRGFLAQYIDKTQHSDLIEQKNQVNEPITEYLEKDRPWLILDEIDTIRKDLDVPFVTIALAWLLEKNVIPVVGVSNVVQLEEILQVFSVKLSPDQIKGLDEISFYNEIPLSLWHIMYNDNYIPWVEEVLENTQKVNKNRSTGEILFQ